ncbi:MAG: hypothetical protein GF333_03625 [Candidatus Omnitrophica bacterium]|nr:hypothetical protein [Candidatus Omnitrophota bacterium]
MSLQRKWYCIIYLCFLIAGVPFSGYCQAHLGYQYLVQQGIQLMKQGDAAGAYRAFYKANMAHPGGEEAQRYLRQLRPREVKRVQGAIGRGKAHTALPRHPDGEDSRGKLRNILPAADTLVTQHEQTLSEIDKVTEETAALEQRIEALREELQALKPTPGYATAAVSEQERMAPAARASEREATDIGIALREENRMLKAYNKFLASAREKSGGGGDDLAVRIEQRETMRVLRARNAHLAGQLRELKERVVPLQSRIAELEEENLLREGEVVRLRKRLAESARRGAAAKPEIANEWERKEEMRLLRVRNSYLVRQLHQLKGRLQPLSQRVRVLEREGRSLTERNEDLQQRASAEFRRGREAARTELREAQKARQDEFEQLSVRLSLVQDQLGHVSAARDSLVEENRALQNRNEFLEVRLDELVKETVHISRLERKNRELTRENVNLLTRVRDGPEKSPPPPAAVTYDTAPLAQARRAQIAAEEETRLFREKNSRLHAQLEELRRKIDQFTQEEAEGECTAR